MLKKILSAIIAVVMLAMTFVLAGCSTGSNDEETDLRLPMTLNFIGITKESTTPEAIQMVEDAINNILSNTYETKIKLTLVTEDKYMELVQSRIDEANYLLDLDAAVAKYNTYAQRVANKQAAASATSNTSFFGKWKKAAVTVVADTVTSREKYTAEQTTIDENGLISTLYPDPYSPLDILMIDGYEMFSEFMKLDVLSDMASLIKSGSSIADYTAFAQFIYPTFLSQISSLSGGTYAIPTNTLLAEYTYLVVDEKLAEKYNFNINTFNGFADLEEFLTQVKENENVTPFEGVPDCLGIFYPFGEDVAIATYYDPMVGYNAEEGTTFEIKNLFDIKQYVDYCTLMENYTEKGFFTEKGEGFAVKVVKGDASVPDTYGDDYQVEIIQKPYVEKDIIFDGMLAVSKYTQDDTRALEVIQAITTNKELKNLLQYGIEGDNYTVNDDGKTITRLNDSYMMDTLLTGNVLMGYPEEGMLADLWTYYKTTNLDSALSPFLVYPISDDSLESQLNTFIYRAEMTEAVEKVLGITYDSFVNSLSTAEGTTNMTKLKNAHKEYLYQCLRDEGISESALASAFSGTSVRSNDWFREKIADYYSCNLYKSIVTEPGLNKQIQDKIAEILGIKYDKFEDNRKKAADYYTNIRYLRIMAEVLLFTEASDEELAAYNDMTAAEFEKAVIEYVTKTFISDNNLSESQYDALVKEYITSEMSFYDNLGNQYTVTWDEINAKYNESKDFIEGVDKLTSYYSDLLSKVSGFSGSDLASKTPVQIYNQIHTELYNEFVANEGTTVLKYETSVYDEILSPFGITKAELDALKSRDKNGYTSYINRVKSTYKNRILEYYSNEEYKESGNYALTAVEVLQAVLNSFIEDKTQIYHTMAGVAGMSYGAMTEGAVNCGEYIQYVNQMRTKNIYTLRAYYSSSYANNLKYNEIQDAVYEAIYNYGFYTNETAKLVGTSLSDYSLAKSNASSYQSNIQKLIDSFKDDFVALGYDLEKVPDMDPDKIEDIIFEIIEKEYFSNILGIEDFLLNTSAEYVKGIKDTNDVAAYCANASAELKTEKSGYLFTSIIATLQAGLKEFLDENNNA
ncbi:MAG: hypothetical protein K6F14_09000 [Clostridiales bacterium]|nr:hypothetical protein [Clostridiales bacterium]